MTSEPEINPYESPREATVASAQSSRLDLVFFLINFVGSFGFIFLAVIAIVDSLFGGGSPFGFLGAVFFMGPATLFAIGEWLLFLGKREGLRRPLGVVCGLISAFWAFAFVTNVFEALGDPKTPDTRPDPPDMMFFWLIFGSIYVTISSYNAYCCWHEWHSRNS